jgi:hypothetical protein
MRVRRAFERFTRAFWIPALAVLLAAATAQALPAQLISPGRLAQPHASLEGVTNCTQCHDLGTPGISNAKCLQCHTVLRSRIEAREGLHATWANRSCAACHKDHFGTDFQMVRFDTASFDHARVGYTLRLAHREEGCRSCHTPALISDATVRSYASRHGVLARTYLGLGRNCTDCHRSDNVHGQQFGTRSCESCHAEDKWDEPSRFHHDSSRYVLTGRHQSVECASCHRPMPGSSAEKPMYRYAGLRFQTCTACHTDPHRGAMRQSCEQCHSTEGWRLLRNRSGFESTFNHAQTDFTLRGAHAALACASCHDPRRPASATIRIRWEPAQARAMYPAPIAATCASCHVDAHEGTFADTSGGSNCASCHGDVAWVPSSYDLVRHNRESYVLTGAHVTVACSQCHQPTRPAGPPQFKLPGRDCESCHKSADPHAGQFSGRSCTACHSTESFRIAAFNHDSTRYPLDATHRRVACAQCHTQVSGDDGKPFTRYRPLETSCRSCHGGSSPRRP